MKIPNFDVRVSLKNKPEGFNVKVPSEKIDYKKIKYAKTPQMGLINFSGNRCQAIADLMRGASKVCETNKKYANLEWEMQTAKPKAQRIKQIADSLGELAVLSQKQTKSRIIKNSLKVINEEGTGGLSDFHKALVRDWNKSIDVATKLPPEFVEEQSKLIVHSNNAWAKARANNDFKYFEPYLVKVFSFAKKGANYIDPKKTPLDVFFDDLGYTTKEVDKIFTDLKQELVPLAKEIASKSKINMEILNKPVNSKQLQAFAIEIAKDMGLDISRTRIGKTEHSFMLGIDSPKEIGVAISQPNKKVINVADAIDILTSFTHEAGHGLVELGAAPELYRTGLTGATLGIHESQSRLWENIVGRSKEFWQHYYPKLQDKVEGFKEIKFDDFYNAMNFVEPSLIRTKADEVTYNLHIMLRHDIEKELLNPELSEAEMKKLISKLPETWNNKMEEYLGIRPQNDSQGVLQDVHWSESLIGYFPSYAIGNLCSAQFINTAKKEIPDLESKIASGDLKILSSWLTEKIYKNGEIYAPDEIMQKVTGESLNPKYFMNYLKAKYLG